MIFLSRIVPITGVAQPGKNLPPTKTSEPGLGWGSHILLGLTNRGNSGPEGTLHLTSSYSYFLCLHLLTHSGHWDNSPFRGEFPEKQALTSCEGRTQIKSRALNHVNTLKPNETDTSHCTCLLNECLKILEFRAIALSQRVAIRQGMYLCYFGNILQRGKSQNQQSELWAHPIFGWMRENVDVCELRNQTARLSWL